jgi:hypothetical protein
MDSRITAIRLGNSAVVHRLLWCEQGAVMSVASMVHRAPISPTPDLELTPSGADAVWI